jgi:hypothetical protein
MNLKPETMQIVIDVTHSIARAYCNRYKAKTWDQDLNIQQSVDSFVELLIEAIQEDAMWQVAQWKEERDYIRSLEQRVKALLELEEAGCVHPHHEQEYQSSLQAERDFYGLDD